MNNQQLDSLPGADPLAMFKMNMASLMAGGVPFLKEAGIGGASGSGPLGLPLPPPLAAFGSLGGVGGFENLAALNLAMSGLQQLAGPGGPNPLNMNLNMNVNAFAGLPTLSAGAAAGAGGPDGSPQSPNVPTSQQMPMPPFGMPMPPLPGLGMGVGGLGGLGLGMGFGMGVGPGVGVGMGMGPLGMSVAARRKNATRETTSTLKSWLQGHRKNPYPTKAEKIMLAILTKMTLTQVSTWFANARRRLKKETRSSSPGGPNHSHGGADGCTSPGSSSPGLKDCADDREDDAERESHADDADLDIDVDVDSDADSICSRSERQPLEATSPKRSSFAPDGLSTALPGAASEADASLTAALQASVQRSLQRAHSSSNARPSSPSAAFPSSQMPPLDELKQMLSPPAQLNALIGAPDGSAAVGSEERRAMLAHNSAVARLYEQMQLQAQAASAASASQTQTPPAHTHSAQPQRPGAERAADTNAARDASGPIDYSTSGAGGRRAAGKIWSPADLVSQPQQPFPNPNPLAAAACGPLTHCPLTPQSPFQRSAAFEAAGAAAALHHHHHHHQHQQQQQQQQQAGLELLQLAATMLGQSALPSQPQFDAAAAASATWPAWPPQQQQPPLGLPDGCVADQSAAALSDQQLNLLRYLYLANVAMAAGAGAGAPAASDAGAPTTGAAQTQVQLQSQPPSASPRQTGRESALSPLTPHTPPQAPSRAEPVHA